MRADNRTPSTPIPWGLCDTGENVLKEVKAFVTELAQRRLQARMAACTYHAVLIVCIAAPHNRAAYGVQISFEASAAFCAILYRSDPSPRFLDNPRIVFCMAEGHQNQPAMGSLILVRLVHKTGYAHKTARNFLCAKRSYALFYTTIKA